VAKLGIRLAIIAVVLVGGFVLRDRLSGSAGELKVGDCFDDTTGAEVSEVQHHPCSEAHNAEVVLVADHPAAKDAAYPTDNFDSYEQTCSAAAFAYVGANAPDNLIYSFYYPLEEDWKKGKRKMICYVTTENLQVLTKSMKAATR
jgi:putative regulator of septum formation